MSIDEPMHIARDDHSYVLRAGWWSHPLPQGAGIALGGVLDFVAAPAVHHLLHEYVLQADSGLVIDLTEVTLPSAALVGVLERARRLATASGTDLSLRLLRGSLAYRVATATLDPGWQLELLDDASAAG